MNHWKQQEEEITNFEAVVICFQISIFEPLETATQLAYRRFGGL
ncbi:hypothetical protein M141_3988 [Bacteroides fragilis str. S38L5]|nr:hypothetical protein M141_3988 [Bacteroides fragilis str. S38L5]EYB12345.1 hypothetical protein M140_3943 [Bacteroides fragilis str. S38L3]